MWTKAVLKMAEYLASIFGTEKDKWAVLFVIYVPTTTLGVVGPESLDFYLQCGLY